MIDSMDTKQTFRRWAEASTSMMEPFIRLNQLTLQTMERLSESQIEAGREYIALQKEQLDRLGKTQDLSDFADNQQKLITGFSSVLRRHLEKLQGISGETRQAYADWTQDAVGKAASQTGESMREFTKSANESMRGAAEKAHKETRAAAGK